MALPSNIEQQRAADKIAARKAAEQDVFMREVDEAVRQDRMSQTVQRYGVPMLTVVVLGLAALGAWLFWQSRQEAALERRSEQLVIAYDALDAGRYARADEVLTPLIEEADGSTAAVLARLARAGAALADNRRDEAVEIFEAVAADRSAPAPYRDLAAVRLSAAQFEEVEPDVIIQRLRPLAVPGNPWFGSAGELLAVAYLEQGREDLAGPLLAEIAKDDEVPQTLRSRTRQLAGLLGHDAVEDVDQTLAEMQGAEMQGAEMQGAAMQEGALPFPAGAQ